MDILYRKRIKKSVLDELWKLAVPNAKGESHEAISWYSLNCPDYEFKSRKE